MPPPGTILHAHVDCFAGMQDGAAYPPRLRMPGCKRQNTIAPLRKTLLLERRTELVNVEIKIDHAVKKYGNNTVIPDLSLDIKPGSFFTLLGPSGLSLIHI